MEQTKFETKILKGRKVTRRQHSRQRMNFLPKLPTEIRHMVLEQLTPKELAKCLVLSKQWRELANDNHLWKRHCVAYGIEADEDKKFQRNNISDLCKWAQIWINFQRSPALGWWTKCWKTLEINSTKHELHASNGNLLAICTGSVLALQEISQLGKNKYSVQLPRIPCNLGSLFMDDRYVVVTVSNIVLIYKIGLNQFKCCMVLAINRYLVHKSYKCTGIRRFIDRYVLEHDADIGIIALSEGCIWLIENGFHKVIVVNISTEKITKVFTHFFQIVTGTTIASWSRTNFRVDDFEGRNILNIRRDVRQACANDHVLVTSSLFAVSEDYVKYMETWEPSTGKKLLSMVVPKDVYFGMHPTRDILYQLETDVGYIISLCPYTGEMFWQTKVPNITSFFNMDLQVVCERFLVLCDQPFVDGGEKPLYVFDALRGQFLYEAERPPGCLELLTSSLMMIRSSHKTYLQTFTK